jgi:DNA-directed RNA polymerase subunit N (RpoN/RPB10)
MVRLVTVNGKSPYITEVENQQDPQKLIDHLCGKCFLCRRYYLTSISDQEPFDLERAKSIMDIMLMKGANDPKSYALGQALRMNWHKFDGIN